MEAKKAVHAGLAVAAAGAGGYFVFSKRFSPTRKQWAEFLKDKVKTLKPMPVQAKA